MIFVKFDSWGDPPADPKYRMNVPAGGEATLTRVALARVVPMHLIVDNDVADWFDLREVRVGMEPVLSAMGDGCPMHIFRRFEKSVEFRSVVWAVNQTLFIVVKNTSSQPRRFHCEIECATLGKP